MSKIPLPRLLRVLAALGGLIASQAAAQHAHINAGIDANSRLTFVNADRFAAESGYFVALPKVTNGFYAGYHIANAPTFTALASTPINGGPSAGHAAAGAHIVARIETVEGPEGGRFGFWETPGDEEDATELTFSVPVGETQGGLEFPLSENSGQAGADPYGHIHGRYFSATLPGLYTVGLRLRDTSSNGPGGGPLHEDSPVIRFLFQAGLTLAKAIPGPEGLELRFAAQSGVSYQVEYTRRLESPEWIAIGSPVTGTGRMASVLVPTPVVGAFFRLRSP